MSPILSAADVALASLGSPVYLGTIDAGATAKTNAEASTPFANTGDGLKNKVLLIANDSTSLTVRFHPVATSTGDATATRNAAGFGVPIGPGERVIVRMLADYAYLAVISPSGAANVDVWELT